jgi:hypothetical protein
MASGTGKRKSDPQVTAASAAPLTGASAKAPVEDPTPKPFLSEGMRVDLETHGYAIDPVSGARFELDRETGKVTVTELTRTDPNTGEVTEGKVTVLDDVVITTPKVETTTDPDTGEVLTTDAVTGVTTATDPVTGETRVVE